MKYQITNINQVGTKGVGQYVLTDKNNPKKRRVINYCGTESKVDQAQAEMTDISKLLEPAMRRGLLKHSIQYTDQYDDIPATSYQEALNTLAKANQMFDDLPVNMRNRFNNDPKEFLEFTHNPANAPEMSKLGMLKGNDGLTSTGAPSGAPTKTDINGDGVPDPKPAEVVAPTP